MDVRARALLTEVGLSSPTSDDSVDNDRVVVRASN